jgi:protein-S-isoprenylcysteine O-methyltransferase Ste14
MRSGESRELPSTQQDATGIVCVGGWLFRHRTIIPVPLAVALLGMNIGAAAPSIALTLTGISLVAAGEAMRLWGVRHIGVISRTRSERLGPLVESGPFALVRNPLYLGNIALWVGFAVSARLLWLAPVVALILGLEYHAIVRWEEQLLEARNGEPYREYLARVPRWIPSRGSRASGPVVAPHSWREMLFSERGTLIAIAVGYGLLWLKAQV